jgi:hypothetical protein
MKSCLLCLNKSSVLYCYYLFVLCGLVKDILESRKKPFDLGK